MSLRFKYSFYCTENQWINSPKISLTPFSLDFSKNNFMAESQQNISQFAQILFDKYGICKPTIHIDLDKVKKDLEEAIRELITQLNLEVKPEEIQKKRKSYTRLPECSFKHRCMERTDEEIAEEIKSGRATDCDIKIYDILLRPNLKKYIKEKDSKPYTDEEEEEKEYWIMDDLYNFVGKVEG